MDQKNMIRLAVGIGAVLLVVGIWSLVSAGSDIRSADQALATTVTPSPSAVPGTSTPAAAAPAPTSTVEAPVPTATAAVANPPTSTPVPAPAAPPPTTAPSQPTSPQSAVMPAAPGRRNELAPIDGIEVLTQPPSYTLRIKAGLPSGCAQRAGYEWSMQGDTVRVQVWNSMPASNNVVCTTIYGMYEVNISLGSNFQSGRQYTVQVNDQRTTFTAR